MSRRISTAISGRGDLVFAGRLGMVLSYLPAPFEAMLDKASLLNLITRFCHPSRPCDFFLSWF